VAETLRAFGGRLDVLFNNAGVFHPHNAIDCTEDEWDATLDSSLKGAWLMSKYALPTMIAQRRGVIIHQASGWGIQGGDQAIAYCAAKGGVVVMTKAMAIDHGPQGIRVNCLCPGDVETPMLAADAAARGQTYADYMKGAANRPLGRVGTPAELARAALFLASDDSSFMTGAALVVDGGGIAG
jgi:NAD(P)-dependent dehydrogenase (short-subunit alcohol dehydrogenase family)